MMLTSDGYRMRLDQYAAVVVDVKIQGEGEIPGWVDTFR